MSNTPISEQPGQPAVPAPARPDPIVRADALAHVVFERKDVATMERFLTDFGFLPCDSSSGKSRYFRTRGNFPYGVELIASERDAFVGFGFVAGSRSDLEKLAAAEGASIEAIEGPGGGERVRLVDPSGFRVDLIHGFTPVEPVPTRAPITQFNSPGTAIRVNAGVRTEVAPSPIKRMGHVVLQTPLFGEMMAWYTGRFGLIPSDMQTLPDGTPALAFCRLDRGSSPADHHSLALVAGPAPKLLHVSTETIDLDAIGQGQQFLWMQGWHHFWGMGRHRLGSQLFDYWHDSVGDEWEHYADGDVMTADYPTGFHPLTLSGLWEWGQDLPQSMRPALPPPPEAPPPVRALIEALRKPARPWWPELD
ncbi:glyoxalase [Burkholderia sp. Bp9142]|uniref:glyoxalase n=1 Tax=Burkholderia sp. Bp9142 TaxID=2184573 RepID=UPI000F5B421D|nr:glyoxalase [Burkholderia sp. Bp9142]RQR24592.1 glyoxalase [Burkholderia sp. Bp9142]